MAVAVAMRHVGKLRSDPRHERVPLVRQPQPHRLAQRISPLFGLATGVQPESAVAEIKASANHTRFWVNSLTTYRVSCPFSGWRPSIEDDLIDLIRIARRRDLGSLRATCGEHHPDNAECTWRWHRPQELDCIVVQEFGLDLGPTCGGNTVDAQSSRRRPSRLPSLVGRSWLLFRALRLGKSLGQRGSGQWRCLQNWLHRALSGKQADDTGDRRCGILRPQTRQSRSRTSSSTLQNPCLWANGMASCRPPCPAAISKKRKQDKKVTAQNLAISSHLTDR